MTTETTLWHRETLREITQLAIMKLHRKSLDEVGEKALHRLESFGTLVGFVQQLAYLHLSYGHRNGEWLSARDIWSAWKEWSSSDDSRHALWYTPMTRGNATFLDLTISDCVAQAAENIMRYAEIRIPIEDGTTTYGAYATPEHVLQHG